MRRVLVWMTMLMLATLPTSVWAQEPATEPPAAFEEITPETQRAIERGLAYLARSQRDDGSWSYSGEGGNIGITALGGLAMLAGGNVPGRGQYGRNVERAVDFILANVRRDGYITAGNSRMYEHGFATLFLAEVYGMTGQPEVKNKLKLAVRLIEACQNQEGGWRYNPEPYDADISVTICQIMALRSARNAGVKVDHGVIERGIGYVKICQNSDGGFSYMARQNSGSGFARTAAGVCSLYYAGAYEDKAIQQGLEYLYREFPRNLTEAGGHFHYAQYYAVQAMFQAGGKYWRAYYPVMRDQLVKTQQGDGSWAGGPTEGPYRAAMSCIILEIPYRYLPILER